VALWRLPRPDFHRLADTDFQDTPLTLRPARSRSRQATLYIESSDSFVASAAASIASGWSEPVPGREFHPLESSAFHGALLRQLPAP
jgi:predicted HAD superfamily Cof-like phosphohydrolase